MNLKIDNQYSSPFKVVNVDSKGSQSSGLQFKNSSQNQSLFQITSRLHTTSSKNQSLQLLNNYSFAEVKDSLDKAKNAIDTLLIDKLNLQNQLEFYECSQGNNYFDRYNQNQRTNAQSTGNVNIQAAQNYKINMAQLLNQHNIEQNINCNQHQISPKALKIQENLEISEANKDCIPQLTQPSSITNNSNSSYQALSELIDSLQKQNIQYRSQLNKQKDSEEKQQAMKKEINSLTSQLALLNLKMQSMQEQKTKLDKNHKIMSKKKNIKQSCSNSDSSSEEDSYFSSDQSQSNSRSSSNSSITSNTSKDNSKINLDKMQDQDRVQEKKSKEEQKVEMQKRNNKQLIQLFLKNVRMNKDQLFCFRQKFKNESEFYNKLDNKKYSYLFYKMLDYHNQIVQEFQNRNNNLHQTNHYKQNSIESAQNYILRQQQPDQAQNKQNTQQYKIDYNMLKQQIPYRHSTQLQSSSTKQILQLHQKNKSNDSSNYPYTSRPVSSNITKNQYSFLANNQSNHNYSDIMQDLNLQSTNTPLEQSLNTQHNGQNKGSYLFSKFNSQELPSLKQITPDVKDYTTMPSYENTSFNRNIQTIKSQLQTMTSPSHKQSTQSNGTMNNFNTIMDDFEYEESPETVKRQADSLKKIDNFTLNNQSSSHVYNNQKTHNAERNTVFQNKNIFFDKNNSNNLNQKPKTNNQNSNQIINNGKQDQIRNNQDHQNKILYYENYNIFEDRQNMKQQNHVQKQPQQQQQQYIQKSHLSKIYEEQLQLSQQQSEQKFTQQQDQKNNNDKQNLPKYQKMEESDRYYQDFIEEKHSKQQNIEYLKEDRQEFLHEQDQDKQRNKQMTPPQKKVFNHLQAAPERSSNSSDNRKNYSQSAKQKKNLRPPLNEESSSKVNVPSLDLESVEKWNQSGQDSSSNRNSKFKVQKEKQQKQNTQAKYKKQQSASDANTSDGCVTPQSYTNIPRTSHPDNIYYVMPSLREKYLMRKSLQLSNKDENKQLSGYHTGTNQEKKIQDINGHSSSNNSKFNNTSNKEKSGSTESNQFSEGRSIKDFSIANDVKKRIFENQSQDQFKQNSIQLYQNNPNQY
ncbi:hypothetical protein TTHERM_00438790 (macronuclear) [Tetrahymena thermophila SB210]|uniref:Uncharacterized protein n=1 Tax=Tetrahymena thermophila (strain SB210) TaxID=312017 RepID=I7LVA1_TETTS|nr:hypothetical protein TTHERM_00438790 [Tetrahymena thermophila SB210]EAR97531.2 hypothetical protein TTHERM_00438790 [Tetrahymena thermophila SB210]|eukprot:XP_001017776.2 hypothetical protein TTHERM_00438790 [Tetrahymena thermophila SB210]